MKNFPMKSNGFKSYEKQLSDLISRGSQSARSQNKTVLVSTSFLLADAIDPIEIFAMAKGLEAERVFWAKPDRNIWVVGIGCTKELMSNSDDTVTDINDEYKRLLESALIEHAEDFLKGPVFVGGIRFDPKVQKSHVWSGFHDARFVLPKLVFTFSSGETWVTVNVLAADEIDPNMQAKALIAQIEVLCQSGPGKYIQPRIVDANSGSYDEWASWLEQALNSIENDTLSKVVLARRKILIGDGGFSAEAALQNLVQAYPECSVFAHATSPNHFRTLSLTETSKHHSKHEGTVELTVQKLSQTSLLTYYLMEDAIR